MITKGAWRGPGGSWAYERHGDGGGAIVLLHGMMFDRSMWRPISEDLARDHTVVAVDLPGHGASPARAGYAFDDLIGELNALIGSLGLRSPVLVGHSAAALLATVYGARHEVQAVVNVDQPLAISELAERLQGAGRLDDDQFAQLAELLIASMRLDAVPPPHRTLVTPRPQRDVFIGWQQQLLSSTPQELQAWIEATARAVTAPYLAIFSRSPWPGHDSWLRELIPQARCEVYNVEGHFPHLLDVPRFTRSLRQLHT